MEVDGIGRKSWIGRNRLCQLTLFAYDADMKAEEPGILRECVYNRSCVVVMRINWTN